MNMGQEQDIFPRLPAPLLAWYDTHARVLPWRGNPAPYRVWISEIMLQQTRVEAVKPYFERFLAELPDLEALAAVPEDVLLKLWRGSATIIVSATSGKPQKRFWNVTAAYFRPLAKN